ncbi:hypothetical protein [Paenarthrobacter nitroguajacolicus]|uniref:hypothetical protein n=1 Tax=Paenarthrobacter nitroguajacolicus TaxID=211146 RepID=UPI003C7D554E
MGRSCIGWNQPGRHRWRARTRRTASCSTAGPVRQHSAGHFNAGHPRRNSNHDADALDAGHPRRNSNHDADALTFRDGHTDALTFRDGHTDANPDNHCYADSDDHCNADSDWHLHAIAVDQCPGNQYRPADADHGPGGTNSSIGHRPAAGGC